MFGFGSKTHVVLDIRHASTFVEFVEVDRAGALHSVARTTIPYGVGGPGRASGVQLITEVKATLAKYPQLHPATGIVFLHAPLCKRASETYTKKAQNQTVTQSLIASILDEMSPIAPDRHVTHAYVAAYRVNGYQVHDPRGMAAREFSIDYVRTTVSHDVYTQLLLPLQGVCGVPVVAANYADTLVRLLARDTHIADARVIDIRPEGAESIVVTRGIYTQSATVSYGMQALLTTIRETTEMSDQDIQTSLPLLAAKTLEESVATRLHQGVVSAAAALMKALQESDTRTAYPVPLLVAASAEMHAWGDVLVAELPFASMVPPSDLPALASVVGV